MVLVTSATRGPPLPEAIDLITQSDIEFVLPTRRNGLRGALDAALMAADVVLQPKFEIDLLSTIVQFVEQTSIATILPRVVVQEKVDKGLLQARTIVSPPIVRHIIQVTHPKRPLGPASQALIAIITEEIRRVTTGARD